MKRLVNFTYSRATDTYQILETPYVSVPIPELGIQVAVLDTDMPIKKPLVVPIRNQLTVVDWDEYEKFNKRFYLVPNQDGTVTENPKGTPIWLPKDTNVADLRHRQGQVYLVEADQNENENEKKETVKKVNKPTKSKKES